jgi:fatty acid desaturase
LAPRALKDSVRPRRTAGVVMRPLNFTVRPRVVKVIALTVLIAVCHVAVVFAAFATHVFGLSRFIPGLPALLVGVVIPTLIAGVAYYKVAFSLRRLSRAAGVAIASLCTLATLYVGFFLEVNTFGS